MCSTSSNSLHGSNITRYIYSRFISRGVLHPLILSMVLMFLQSWSGMNVLVFKVGFTSIDVCITKLERNKIIYSEQGGTRAFV